MCTGSGCLCSRHDSYKWKDNLCPLESWWQGVIRWRRQQKTSHKDIRRRKFMSSRLPKVGVLDSVDKHVRTRKKFKVCVCSLFTTMICCLFFSSWLSSHVSILPFFLPATACYLVVNKQLNQWFPTNFEPYPILVFLKFWCPLLYLILIYSKLYCNSCVECLKGH